LELCIVKAVHDVMGRGFQLRRHRASQEAHMDKVPAVVDLEQDGTEHRAIPVYKPEKRPGRDFPGISTTIAERFVPS
jgi:hypothetical protein